MSRFILVKGNDELALNEAVLTLIDELIGDGDRGLMLEVVDDHQMVKADGEISCAPAAAAAATPPFLTERRVVVIRHGALLRNKELLAPLLAYLDDPLDSTDLVLVWEPSSDAHRTHGKTVPKSLQDAAKKLGRVVDAGIGSGKKRTEWLDDRLRSAAVVLDREAKRMLVESLGEDISRVDGILTALESAYGPGAKVDHQKLAPLLSDPGGVVPWDLTDAIAEGNVAGAVQTVRRMMGAGGRAGVAVLMFPLLDHFDKVLALDGSGAKTDQQAAEVLGVNSPWLAKRPRAHAARMTSPQVSECIHLLSEADLALKGAVNLPDGVILEVLVARLAQRAKKRSA